MALDVYFIEDILATHQAIAYAALTNARMQGITDVGICRCTVNFLVEAAIAFKSDPGEAVEQLLANLQIVGRSDLLEWVCEALPTARPPLQRPAP